MNAVPPLALAGDELRVLCLDGGQCRYLSLDAAATTGTLPSVLDAVQAFVPWYASVQGQQATNHRHRLLPVNAQGSRR